ELRKLARDVNPHLVACSFPATFELECRVEVDSYRQHHVELIGEDACYECIGIADESNNDPVQRRAALVVVLEPGQLHVRAELPGRQLVRPEAHELCREPWTVRERFFVAVIELLQDMPR